LILTNHISEAREVSSSLSFYETGDKTDVGRS